MRLDVRRRRRPLTACSKHSAGAAAVTTSDLEDVVLLVDGREELATEVAAAPAELREFLAAEIDDLLRRPAFKDALFGFLRADMASQARADTVVLPRLRELVLST
jgi:hypothetical protein